MCNKKVVNIKFGFIWIFQEDLYLGKNYVYIIIVLGIKKNLQGFYS